MKTLKGKVDPLWMPKDWNGTDKTVSTSPGDTIIWYTDGLVECTDPEGNQIGKSFLHKAD